MTVEEAYAAPVAPKRQRNRAFVIGLVVGIVAGAVAVLLLNRAAEDDDATFEEPVVELQPALAGEGSTTRFPVTPLGSTSSTSSGRVTNDTYRTAAHPESAIPPVVAAVPPVPPGGETERPV